MSRVMAEKAEVAYCRSVTWDPDGPGEGRPCNGPAMVNHPLPDGQLVNWAGYVPTGPIPVDATYDWSMLIYDKDTVPASARSDPNIVFDTIASVTPVDRTLEDRFSRTMREKGVQFRENGRREFR